MALLKIGTRVLWIGIVTVLGVGCSPSSTPAPTSENAEPAVVEVDDALVQFSLLSALASGDYGSGAPLREVLGSGDFGIGTFSRLDGEMIVLDGKMYQALADGTVRAADLDGTTPFAAVTYFDEDGRIEDVAATSLDDLDEQLDRKLPRRNAPYAIRIDGEFAELTLRSVPAQSPPFQPLVDVVEHQVTWQHRNVRGTLVGLRCPAWIGTLNVPGYHWHFLSDDHEIGGHVLACGFRGGSLRFDECVSIVIHLPQSSEFDHFDVGEIKTQDIDQIERQRSRTGRP
ncbi:MAG: acetolactate decarboxylase [Planctomycetaceae bacterium]